MCVLNRAKLGFCPTSMVHCVCVCVCVLSSRRKHWVLIEFSQNMKIVLSGTTLRISGNTQRLGNLVFSGQATASSQQAAPLRRWRRRRTSSSSSCYTTVPPNPSKTPKFPPQSPNPQSYASIHHRTIHPPFSPTLRNSLARLSHSFAVALSWPRSPKASPSSNSCFSSPVCA